MRIGLICPSNILYMPYVENYEKILKENNINYSIINWDRFGIEDKDQTVRYQDDKYGHQRNFFDYYKYKKFVVEKLEFEKYDKIIVFGIPLTFFLRKILKKSFKDNYYIDIRDYHKIIKYFNLKNIINNSELTTISSVGYKKWLPKSKKYILNHNIRLDDINGIEQVKKIPNGNKIILSYIGSIRDYKVNIKLINSLKNSENIDLYYHGEGKENRLINDHIKTNNIKNVFLSGRYEKKEEKALYLDSDLINIILPNEDVNSKTLLPNRLYNSVIYGKPLLAFSGTYLAEIIQEFELGLVLDSFEDIEKKIKSYMEHFDENNYDKKRRIFSEEVIAENKEFERYLLEKLY